MKVHVALFIFSISCQPILTEDLTNAHVTVETQEETDTSATTFQPEDKSIDVDKITKQVIESLTEQQNDDNPAMLSTSLGGKIASVVISHMQHLSTTQKVSAYLGLTHIVGIIIMKIVNRIKKRKLEKLMQKQAEEAQKGQIC